MTPDTPERGTRVRRHLEFWPEFGHGFENLRAHKLRSLLTMLGMIFGVAAVIAMLSIGAGAQQKMIAFIEQLGVRNVIGAEHGDGIGEHGQLRRQELLVEAAE